MSESTARPHILHRHEVVHPDGRTKIVSELLDGRTPEIFHYIVYVDGNKESKALASITSSQKTAGDSVDKLFSVIEGAYQPKSTIPEEQRLPEIVDLEKSLAAEMESMPEKARTVFPEEMKEAVRNFTKEALAPTVIPAEVTSSHRAAHITDPTVGI